MKISEYYDLPDFDPNNLSKAKIKHYVDMIKQRYIIYWQRTIHHSKKFYNQIQQNFVDFNQLSYTELIIQLMNSQNFSLNSHLLKFVSSCNDVRTNLLSNHADDT